MIAELSGTCMVRCAISVVIPHFNDFDNLSVCLDALAHQSLDRSSFEIIVADNNSTRDQSRLTHLCAQHGAKLVAAPIQGAAEARNAGVQNACGQVLAFIDSDCRPAPSWLEAGLAALETADMVGGKVEVVVPDPAALTPVEAFETVFAFNNERYIREEHFSVTANMFTTRSVFDRVGGFRAGVSEDLDWGRRAFALGYCWAYAPAALVEHPARRTVDDLTRKWRRLTAEGFALACEQPGGHAKWLVRNWLMLLSLPLSVPHVCTSNRLSVVRDRTQVLRILLWIRWWRFREAHRLVLLR